MGSFKVPSLLARGYFKELYEVVMEFGSKEDKMRNPIRTWMDYNGRNMTAIAAEPACKAIRHFGKLYMVNAGIGILFSAGVVCAIYAGHKVYEKVQEKTASE